MSIQRILAQACVATCLVWIPAHANAASHDCSRADAALETTGRGDSDHDGISNCTEKWTLGTNPRDWDSDDDAVADAQEGADGTNPVDADSDDDGLDDGAEHALGTSATDPDSDGDQIGDLQDEDPRHELAERVEGKVLAITCPSGGSDGSLTIHGIVITLNDATEFKHPHSCDAVTMNGAHAKVGLDAADTGLVAETVHLDDADNDGSPDDVDSDDDNDGNSDDVDSDDDNDGVPDSDEDGSSHGSGHD